MVAGPTWARGEHDEVRPQVVQCFGVKPSPHRHHLRTGLAEIVGEGMHKRILMVDEENTLSLTRACDVGRRLKREPTGGPDRVDEGGGLKVCLALFLVRIRVVEEGGSDADLGNAVFDTDGT